jgi:hypothetical protein
MRRLVLIGMLTAAFVLEPGAAEARIPSRRLGVGDSIMLSASDELSAFEVDVNAEVGRQFSKGVSVVRRLANHDRLPRIVVVHLGTNGYVQPEDCVELVLSAPHRRIFLVSLVVPRDWEDPNNEVLNACAASYERVHMLRWAVFSKDHPEWFADDGYHINAEGQEAYAGFLVDGVRETLARVRAR